MNLTPISLEHANTLIGAPLDSFTLSVFAVGLPSPYEEREWTLLLLVADPDQVAPTTPVFQVWLWREGEEEECVASSSSFPLLQQRLAFFFSSL